MRREIYDDDHEAFRSSVREFLEREVVPDLEQHAEEKALPREFWVEAGKQGFLGLEVPEEYGGARLQGRGTTASTRSSPRSSPRST